MPLRSEQVRSTGGVLYAHVFENHRTGLRRNVYWNLFVDCEPIGWDEEQWNCAILCDWLSWPVRRWPELDGMTLARVADLGLVEGSFYFADHHPLEVRSLRLQRVRGSARFILDLEASFGLSGFGDLDAPKVDVALSAEVTFEGLFIVPDSFVPKPATPAEAAAVAASHLRLADFREPKWDRFRFTFEPDKTAV